MACPQASAPVVMVTDAYVGKPVDVGPALRLVGQRFLSIWGAAILSGLAMGFGFLLLIVPGVIAFVRLFAMPAAVMAEGASASESWERSSELTRGFTWHILATLGVAYIIFWFAVFGVSFGLAVAGASDRLLEAANSIVMVAVYPFVGVVSALLYIDLRVRKEALDVQLLAQALEVHPAPAAVA